jgi:hypothetical protein
MFDVLSSSTITAGDAYTAAYNAIRILQYRHQLRPSDYMRFLRSHEDKPSGRKLTFAIRLIKEIEEREGKYVRDLSPRLASSYETRLADAASKRADRESTRSNTGNRLLIELEREVVAPGERIAKRRSNHVERPKSTSKRAG